MERNYSNISPSAKMLLLMKGLTPLPYAKEAAELISRPEKYVPDHENGDLMYWMRVMHFEERYTSVNQLLTGLEAKNMLELSSGFSFRGLDICTRQEGIHYIDTDLPGVIETKRSLLDDMNASPARGSRLELLPLNAVDEAEFKKVISRFDNGPVIFINEGLLMYLDEEEKKGLCGNIRDTLKERGGYWVTADIYIKDKRAEVPMSGKDELSQLVQRERIEEKKFESYEHAAEFFKEQGFVVDQVAEPDYLSLASLQHLVKRLPPEMLNSNEKPPRIHETWRMKLAG